MAAWWKRISSAALDQLQADLGGADFSVAADLSLCL